MIHVETYTHFVAGSGSSDDDEISDSEEYETDSGEEESVEKVYEEVKKNDKAKKKKGKNNSRKPTRESDANYDRDTGDAVSARMQGMWKLLSDFFRRGSLVSMQKQNEELKRRSYAD